MTKKLNFTIFVIFGIFFLFLILNLSINLTGFGDDGHLFLEPLSKKFNGNEIAYLIDRYHSWSSRLIIEYFTLLSVQHHIFWKVLNSIAMTTVAVAPIFVFDFKKDKIKLMVTSASLLLFLPISMLNGAGWIATTTNYLWVLACFWGFMLITANIIRLNKINWFSYIFSLFLVAYASNLEQASILLILCIIALCFYMYKTKRKFLFLLPSFFISLANLLFILTTPGNNVRYARSVVHWFPDYESLTFLRKCELSFSSSFRELFFQNQLLFFILTLVIAFALYKSNQGFQTFIALLPIVTYLAFNTFYQTLSDQIPGLIKIKESFTSYGTNFSMNHPKTWITDLLIITIILVIFFAIYFIFKDEPSKAMILIGILTLGIITKMILGFSPTVWASGSRTSIFLYSSISVLILCIIDKFKQNQLLFGIINSLGFLCLLNFLLIPS